jgi:large subunit ribosomal protein L10
MAHKAHVAPWKKKEVTEIENLLTSHPVVALVTIDDIPASSMQRIRAGLRDKAVVRSGKNNLIMLALEGAEKKVPGIKKLEAEMSGQTAIVASELNPFALFKQFQNARTHAPARAGQIAPMDIEVKKGDTPFKPGPIVGDLQKAGIPAAIEAGKVVIKQNKVVVKEGEAISADLAGALDKLGIHPIEIGFDVRAVYEKGLLYKSDVLAVDEEAFKLKFNTAIRNALALAIDRSWFTPQTTPMLITKAARNALAVGIEANFLTKETVNPVLSKAYLQMLALAKLAKGEALDEELTAALGAVAAPAAAADEGADKKAKKEEPKEEQVSEEEAAEGLGALFG